MQNVLDSYKFSELSERKKQMLLGAKVETLHFGIGTVAMTDNKKVMIKKIVKCNAGKHKKTIYLSDAFTTGDLSNVYNKKGEYEGNFGNDIFNICNCK